MGSTHPLDDAPRGVKFELTDPRCIVARSNKRVGMATSKSLNGPWTRRDRPILETKPNTFYNFLTSNPAPVMHDDGSVLMVFKARKYTDKNTFSAQMLGVAKAQNFMGPYSVIVDEPIFSPTKFGEAEDPFVWKTEGGYQLVAKDMTGKLTGEKHAGVHAQSKDGITWQLMPNPKAWSRTITWDDGKTEKLGQLERPCVLIENGRPAYLFAACGDGPGGFANMSQSFTVAIPLARQ
jgi:hypothetical protein